VFVEEVEQALKAHPAVADALVVGRPSDRWGSEVVAVIELRPNHSDLADIELSSNLRENLAVYKIPKEITRVPQIRRGPSGKADYPWAVGLAQQSALSPAPSSDVIA
jgi:fatty-acyl-CoA synthase